MLLLDVDSAYFWLPKNEWKQVKNNSLLYCETIMVNAVKQPNVTPNIVIIYGDFKKVTAFVVGLRNKKF